MVSKFVVMITIFYCSEYIHIYTARVHILFYYLFYVYVCSS